MKEDFDSKKYWADVAEFWRRPENQEQVEWNKRHDEKLKGLIPLLEPYRKYILEYYNIERKPFKRKNDK